MSTVLDVAICLLLVGAAIATLAAGVPTSPPERPDADPDATVLATATASVPSEDCRVHDTLAGHLATAAILEATVAGEPFVRSEYPSAVSAETESAFDERVSITARWEPYSDAPVSGTVSVGDPPPPDATVAATALTVPALENASDGSGYEAVADRVATAFVERLFPPDRTRAALVDPHTGSAIAKRYRTAAGAVDVDIESSIENADARSANRALAAAIAAELASDLRSQYPTPEAAAEDANGSVRIVVRRWVP